MLFGSQSIFDQLKNSSTGQFLQACTPAADLDTTLFQLPRVVVVGDANVGKTSVLEAITKCGLFDAKTQTKMPVKLQLLQVPQPLQCRTTLSFQGQHEVMQSVNHAVNRIAGIMTKAEGISGDEICICIEQVLIVSAAHSLHFPL